MNDNLSGTETGALTRRPLAKMPRLYSRLQSGNHALHRYDFNVERPVYAT